MKLLVVSFFISSISTLQAVAQSVAEENRTTPTISGAYYHEPTQRYPHGVLGDTIEYGALLLTFDSGWPDKTIHLPEYLVFEDTEPRLFDLDQDGDLEVITVQSHARFGARLAIFDESGFVTANAFIGTRFRWLAPAGVADLDGDGLVEIAYVDRPHLAKTLRIWRFHDNHLTEVASLPAVSNHRIGERDIAGGVRHCRGQPEIVASSADWTHMLAVTMSNNTLKAREIGQDTSRAAFDRALSCTE